jgi:hypothetical protein
MPGVREQALVLFGRAEQALQFQNVVRETFGAGIEIAAKGARGAHVGSGRPPKTEIDAAGQQRFQRAELFGDDERRMVGKHDAAGADADGPGGRPYMGDDDRGCGACDARHAVVLGKPDAFVALLLGLDRQATGLVERIAHGITFTDG